MNIEILYTTKQDLSNKLLAVYTDNYKLERNLNFKPVLCNNVRQLFLNQKQSNPLFFGKTITIELPTDLTEESFVTSFGDRILRSVSDFGDDKTISALAISIQKD